MNLKPLTPTQWLTRSRSLGPLRAFSFVESLSLLPEQLKSPSEGAREM
jgi:hypothetical protein